MKKLLSVFLALVMIFSCTATAFAVNAETIEVKVKGTSLAPYFELNGKIAFCISPDSVRPKSDVLYTYGYETTIPEIEAAVIAAENYDGECDKDTVYRTLQLVIWSKLDSKINYRDRARKMIGYKAQVLFDALNSAENNKDFTCVFYAYDTSEVPATGSYQTLATFEVNPVEEEPIPEPEVPELINYTVNYFLDNELINSTECVQDETYIFNDLPKAKDGYEVNGWKDEAGKEYFSGEEFVNLVENNNEAINLYATTNPIQYKVNYYIDGEFVESKDCVYGKEYEHKMLFNLGMSKSFTKFNGWFDENKVIVEPGSIFSNLTTINGEEIDFYAYSETIVAPEPEPVPEPITYTVQYWLNEEFVGGQVCQEDAVCNFMELPEVEAGYSVIGWRNEVGTYNPGATFINLSSVDGEVIDLYATSTPIEYVVNYYLDEEIIDTLNCVFDEEYNHINLPTKEGFNVIGWSDANNNYVTPGSAFSNLTAVNNEEVNFYAVTEITVPETTETTTEPETTEEPTTIPETTETPTTVPTTTPTTEEPTTETEITTEKITTTQPTTTPETTVSEITTETTTEEITVIEETTIKETTTEESTIVTEITEEIEITTTEPIVEETTTVPTTEELTTEEPTTEEIMLETPTLLSYTIYYWLDDSIWNVQNCYECAVYTFENLPIVEGCTVNGWTDAEGIYCMPGSSFCNLTDIDGEVINLYAVSTPIETTTEFIEETTEEITEEETTIEEMTTTEIVTLGPPLPPPTTTEIEKETTTEPKIEVLGGNEEMEETTEEKTTTEEETTEPKVEVLGENETLPDGVVVVDTIPKTGDNDTVVLATTMMILSLFGCLYLTLFSKSKKRQFDI